MGKAMEVLLGQATDTDALTALTMASGDSLTVKDPRSDDPVDILTAWAHSQADGQFRIRGSRFHDSTVGIKGIVEDARSAPLFPAGFKERVHSGQVITAEILGSTTASDKNFLALLLRYMNLPGVDVQFLTPEDVMGRMVHLHAFVNTLTLSDSGDWQGTEAINAEDNALKGRTLYALLGYAVDALGAAIAYEGPDTGNMRVGGPCDPEYNDVLRRWFVHLSEIFGEPLIPVINADNRASTFISAGQNEDAANVEVTTYMAELSGS